MKINVNKTKEIRFNSRKTDKFSVKDNYIDNVGEFMYLGSVIAKDDGALEDVKNRIRKANGAFVQLYPIWKSNFISRHTKLKIFNSNVKSVLLYGCETWKTSKIIENKLQVFINRYLRKILKIIWPEIISKRVMGKIRPKKKLNLK